jgi:hypothetical protein
LGLENLGAELLSSWIADSLWRHRVYGTRVNASFGRFSIEPAVVWQELELRTGKGSLASAVWGATASASGRSGKLEINFATTGGGFALQALAAGKSAGSRWEYEYWNIPTGFRQPLLQAHSDPDREWIDYPELDARLENSSTGESGGRAFLRAGGARTFGQVSAAVWRERATRPAAVRISASAQKGISHGTMRIRYAQRSRRIESSREQRHEAGIYTEYRGLFSEIGARRTRSELSSSASVGLHLTSGLRIHTAALGVWEGRATWNAYDPSRSTRQFMTLRVDQRLPFPRGELSLHWRWRSAHASHEAAMSLRIDSSLYL